MLRQLTRLVYFPFIATAVTSISALSNAGPPNGVVMSQFLGQSCYDTANNRLYLAGASGVNNKWIPVGP